ncbi:hypothetical protein K1719_000814 [Acacia pycnantha]|nr:hypothetical protein K1719_000814 [Acacia pycnantha]
MVKLGAALTLFLVILSFFGHGIQAHDGAPKICRETLMLSGTCGGYGVYDCVVAFKEKYGEESNPTNCDCVTVVLQGQCECDIICS